MNPAEVQNFAEVNHSDYPSERPIACCNPNLAAERARKCGELRAATEDELATIRAAVQAGRLAEAGEEGIKVCMVIENYKMAKRFELTLEENSFTYALSTAVWNCPRAAIESDQ